MLTATQRDLLLFINEELGRSGVAPSFDEMKDHLKLASKSNIHRLIEVLAERGFIRRLPNRARAIEVIRLPPTAMSAESAPVEATRPANPCACIPMVGTIAAGVPASAIQAEEGKIAVPPGFVGPGKHFGLRVKGDSMVNAGILDGDVIVVRRQTTAENGDIVVALIDSEEATLKRFRQKGGFISLEAANPEYEARNLPATRVQVQGRLVMVIRSC